jgi:GrpB-like predicted nucleotidyltransferase (UPF0157 family)
MAHILAPYDPAWPERFAMLSARIRACMGPVSIAHIGSTSVPGLAAKPIIDIQISLNDMSAFDPASLIADRFDFAVDITRDDPPPGDNASPENWQKRFLRLDENGTRQAHLHIRVPGRANHRFALLFRDYLRATPAACAAYADMKRAIVEAGGTLHASGGGSYLDLKTPFMQMIFIAAEDWAARIGWQPDA